MNSRSKALDKVYGAGSVLKIEGEQLCKPNADLKYATLQQEGDIVTFHLFLFYF